MDTAPGFPSRYALGAVAVEQDRIGSDALRLYTTAGLLKDDRGQEAGVPSECTSRPRR
jgi:hypothetical protein